MRGIRQLFPVSRPLPEVGTQGSEGKMYRLLMFLLCDVFLEEKDFYNVNHLSSMRKNYHFCTSLFIFGSIKAVELQGGEDGKKKQRKNHF